MFLSLNRKIIYSVSMLFLAFMLIFVITFFTVYAAKIEKDQQASILRNQQYSDLLYRMINLSKEVQLLLTAYPELKVSDEDYIYLSKLGGEDKQLDILLKEQELVMARSKNFDVQYQTINDGVVIIASSSILLILVLLFVAYLINHIVLTPINRISNITEKIGRGDFGLRISPRQDIKFFDEFDELSKIFNQTLDNLQSAISKIKDNEKFLQALIDSIPDGVRVIDENYQIVLANKSYYKQVGHLRRKKISCHLSSFNSEYPCEQQHNQCPLAEILRKGKKSINIIQQFAHNPERHLAVSAAPLVYDNDKKYIVESIRDLSGDISFSHQQKAASLGFLSSSIAHEMKNHLGALRIIIEKLIDKYYADVPDDNDAKKMINMIHHELVNAVGVPERLLKLTRSSNVADAEIDCVSAISDVLGLMDFEAKSKGIDIEFNQPEEPFYIYGNETDFKIAVINIVQNAIKAMPDKGMFKISFKQDKDGLQINFADTGVGIAKENLNNIFTPFFSDGKQNKNASGSGLGLAITKSIVEKLGGVIQVTSVVGKGSCFSFCFSANKKLAKK